MLLGLAKERFVTAQRKSYLLKKMDSYRSSRFISLIIGWFRKKSTARWSSTRLKTVQVMTQTDSMKPSLKVYVIQTTNSLTFFASLPVGIYRCRINLVYAEQALKMQDKASYKRFSYYVQLTKHPHTLYLT